MEEVKTAWHWWWGWETEKVENWLEEMERDGWSLFELEYFILHFKFKKVESRKMRYCIDHQNKVDDNYFELFKEDGWELVDDAISWFIWRKSYESKRPSIYSDTKSLIERNNQQIRNMSIITLITIILLYFVIISDFKLISPVLVVPIAFFIVKIIQLNRNNKKLKQNAIKC